MKITLKGSLGFRALFLLMPCLLVCLQAGCKTNQPTAAELRRLQGYWEGEGPGGSKCSITIAGNSLYYYARPDFWFKTTFTLPAGTDPQQLHATIKEDATSETNSIGQVVVAIFKIEDGTLTLAVSQGPEGPPKTFPARDANPPIARYELKRVQPQKKNDQMHAKTPNSGSAATNPPISFAPLPAP